MHPRTITVSLPGCLPEPVSMNFVSMNFVRRIVF